LVSTHRTKKHARMVLTTFRSCWGCWDLVSKFLDTSSPHPCSVCCSWSSKLVTIMQIKTNSLISTNQGDIWEVLRRRQRRWRPCRLAQVRLFAAFGRLLLWDDRPSVQGARQRESRPLPCPHLFQVYGYRPWLRPLQLLLRWLVRFHRRREWGSHRFVADEHTPSFTLLADWPIEQSLIAFGSAAYLILAAHLIQQNLLYLSVLEAWWHTRR
jgi:hypothetical protein